MTALRGRGRGAVLQCGRGGPWLEVLPILQRGRLRLQRGLLILGTRTQVLLVMNSFSPPSLPIFVCID